MYYVQRLEDIKDILDFRSMHCQDPESWWTEMHTKIRICEQWVIDKLLDVLLDANPINSTSEIIYDYWIELKQKREEVQNNSDKKIMYTYAIQIIYKLAKSMDLNDPYYIELLENQYDVNDLDFDDEWIVLPNKEYIPKNN